MAQQSTAQNQEQLAAMWWLPPDFESLQSAPALQEVVARHFDNARQWARDRKQEHIELVKLMIGQGRQPFQRRLKSRGPISSYLVADLEREAGREAQPFQLQVTVIPAAGRELWQLDAHHVLVTAELLRDSDEHRRLMTPVVRALL
ncbi:MAG TPA: hypothetical protein VFF32_02060 [Dermatophilaceae bacterium]|nr:hypothetical protein [Dermatophilaceae bacterium]